MKQKQTGKQTCTACHMKLGMQASGGTLRHASFHCSRHCRTDAPALGPVLAPVSVAAGLATVPHHTTAAAAAQAPGQEPEAGAMHELTRHPRPMMHGEGRHVAHRLLSTERPRRLLATSKPPACLPCCPIWDAPTTQYSPFIYNWRVLARMPGQVNRAEATHSNVRPPPR